MAAGLPDKDFKEAVVIACSIRSREIHRRGLRRYLSTENFKNTLKRANGNARIEYKI